MNIAKLQAQLQRVPDQALIGYVQNPDGQVPSFLALAELTRRKEIRKAGTTQPQQAKPTVAQQAVSETAQPMQGVAGLPVPDEMFSEQAMAAGGIVAFEEGGEVKRFANQGLVEGEGLSLDELTLMANQAEQQRRDAAMAAYLEAHKNDPRAIRNADQAQATYRAPGNYPNFQANRQEVIGNPNYAGQAAFNKFGLGNDVSLLQNIKDGVVPKVDVPAGFLPEKKTTVDVPTVDVATKKQIRDSAPKVGGIDFNLPDRFKDFTVPDAVKLKREDFVGEAPTLEGIQALRKEAYEKAGVSEDMYGKMQQDIEARRAGMGKEKEDAVANAMIMAGLGIAGGRSQFALQNIAQGAMPAVRELRSDMKDLLNKKDKLAEREFAVMEAQNKFRQTGADSDLKTLTDKQNSYDTARRDYAKTDAQLQDTHIGRVVSADLKRREEQSQTDRALLNAKLEDQRLKISAFSAETQRMAHNKPDFFSTVLGYAEKDPEFNKMKPMDKVKYLDGIMEKQATGGAKNSVEKSNLEKLFANPVTAQYKEFKRIEKAQGLAAAETFKSDYINNRLLGQPGISGGASSGNVVDFNSLP